MTQGSYTVADEFVGVSRIKNENASGFHPPSTHPPIAKVTAQIPVHTSGEGPHLPILNQPARLLFGTSPASSLPVSDLFSGIGPLEHALGYHMERHNVLSTNVAHVETPGFRPKEVNRVSDTSSQDFGRQLSVAMTRTQEGHLPAGAVSGVNHGTVVDSPDAVAGPDGNYVSLDTEAAKVAQNQLRYEVITALTSAQFRQLSYVASDARG